MNNVFVACTGEVINEREVQIIDKWQDNFYRVMVEYKCPYCNGHHLSYLTPRPDVTIEEIVAEMGAQSV